MKEPLNGQWNEFCHQAMKGMKFALAATSALDLFSQALCQSTMSTLPSTIENMDVRPHITAVLRINRPLDEQALTSLIREALEQLYQNQIIFSLAIQVVLAQEPIPSAGIAYALSIHAPEPEGTTSSLPSITEEQGHDFAIYLDGVCGIDERDRAGSHHIEQAIEESNPLKARSMFWVGGLLTGETRVFRGL